MSFVKETGSCAPDNVLDKLTADAITANPHIIEAPTDRLVKVPPFFSK
jgi:hypothetical protein